jgi:DNA repair exonuclease SbcCD ATPase subunit
MRSRLSAAKRSLARLEHEMADIESILDTLRSQRGQAIHCIQACREALAPHRKPPNQVLEAIFTRATPTITLPPHDY